LDAQRLQDDGFVRTTDQNLSSATDAHGCICRAIVDASEDSAASGLAAASTVQSMVVWPVIPKSTPIFVTVASYVSTRWSPVAVH
jgi:hypothetical protein